MDHIMSQESLRSLLIDCEAQLRGAWKVKIQKSDIIILADSRIDSHRDRIVEVWGDETILDVIQQAEEKQALPLLAYVEPRMKISAMMKSADPNEKRAGEEIRTILAGMNDRGGIEVPVLLCVAEGMMATSWRPPSVIAEEIGIDPNADPMDG